MDAQLTATKGWRARAESWWNAWASRSLPVPVSPRIITGMSRSTTLRSLWITAATWVSPVSRYCSEDSCALRAGAAAGRSANVGAAQGPAGLTSARHQTETPLCRCSCLGAFEVPPNSSSRADIGRSNNEEKVRACRALKGRPSWNCALRLADRKRPSGVNTAMPSTRVPRNSGRAWKCSRTALGKLPANIWFSIICADMRTRARVCWW